MSQYKAALIGLGNIAWKLDKDKISKNSLTHVSAYVGNKKTQLVCAFSPDANEIDRFENETGIQGYTDLQKLFLENKPDIVSICSPTPYHMEHVEACLKYNTHMVWLEKPPAESAKDILKLEKMRLFSKNPSRVLVNYQRRYIDSYIRLKNIIKEEKFGKVLAFDCKYSRGLITNGSHILDLIFFLFGDKPCEVVWLDCQGSSENPDFILRFDNKTLIHVSGIDSQFHNIDVSVTFEEGRVSIVHGGMTLRVEEKREHELFSGYYRLVDVSPEILGPGGFGDSFDRALCDLIGSFEESREPLSNLATAYHAQSLVEKVQQSMKHDCTFFS